MHVHVNMLLGDWVRTHAECISPVSLVCLADLFPLVSQQGVRCTAK